MLSGWLLLNLLFLRLPHVHPVIDDRLLNKSDWFAVLDCDLVDSSKALKWDTWTLNRFNHFGKHREHIQVNVVVYFDETLVIRVRRQVVAAVFIFGAERLPGGKTIPYLLHLCEILSQFAILLDEIVNSVFGLPAFPISLHLIFLHHLTLDLVLLNLRYFGWLRTHLQTKLQVPPSFFLDLPRQLVIEPKLLLVAVLHITEFNLRLLMQLALLA